MGLNLVLKHLVLLDENVHKSKLGPATVQVVVFSFDLKVGITLHVIRLDIIHQTWDIDKYAIIDALKKVSNQCATLRYRCGIGVIDVTTAIGRSLSKVSIDWKGMENL